jgi:hypothetical protein
MRIGADAPGTEPSRPYVAAARFVLERSQSRTAAGAPSRHRALSITVRPAHPIGYVSL